MAAELAQMRDQLHDAIEALPLPANFLDLLVDQVKAEEAEELSSGEQCREFWDGWRGLGIGNAATCVGLRGSTKTLPHTYPR